MKRRIAFCLMLVPPVANAHHGVAGVGAAALEGPGAPMESATSATLPKGRVLGYLKLDRAKFKTFDSNPASPESDYANYWIAGLGYGFTPWLSVYAFLPYNEKIDEPGGFTTRGFADMSITAQVGFKYDDRGLRLVPENETADDLEDWHFTVFGGASLPTGNPNLRDSDGNIDPGKSTGFGKPSFSVGATATKMLSPRWTFNAELSHLRFRNHTYDDGNSTKFGPEYRANGALSYRVYSNAAQKVRIDLVGEAQYLYLGRDETNGVEDRATGGRMVYALPGVRLYWNRITAAVGAKRPVWTDLNEKNEQQGAEGKERYRLIFSISTLF